MSSEETGPAESEEEVTAGPPSGEVTRAVTPSAEEFEPAVRPPSEGERVPGLETEEAEGSTEEGASAEGEEEGTPGAGEPPA
jgi:hypothetical protein